MLETLGTFLIPVRINTYFYRVLNKYHIPTKVDLPSVGENAQDQPNNSLLFSSNDTYNGTAPYVTYASAADILGPDTTLAARSTAASLTDWAEQIAKDSGHAVSASALAHVFRIQHGIIFEKSIPSVELLTTASGNNLVSAFWTLLPFSRGSVHIASSNPQTYPSINPNYFMVPWDMTLQTQIAKLAARFWDTQPIRKLVGKRVTPSLVAVPHNATDSQWGRWLKGSCTFPGR